MASASDINAGLCAGGNLSAIDGYRKTLMSVAMASGTDMVDNVAADINEHIREEEARPANQPLRKQARTLLMEEGLPPDPYLNDA